MSLIETTSKLTSKNQTTIPVAVRKVLDIAEGDRICFRISESSGVELFKEVAVLAGDKAVAAYLMFLEKDMIARPSKLSVLVRDPDSDRLLQGVDLTGWLDEDQIA
jgi:bifunctional DNA-binding transcriptional regulator/antitoxin component of YhaV-PrlF toxin-antitoxin module